MTENVKKDDIGYAWNLVAPLGNDCQISISGNFLKGTSAQAMNTELDKVHSVVNRQQAKNATIGVGQEVDRLIMMKNSAIEDLARIDDKNSTKNNLSQQDKQQREAAVIHIEKMGKDIEYKQGVLEKLKKEAE